MVPPGRPGGESCFDGGCRSNSSMRSASELLIIERHVSGVGRICVYRFIRIRFSWSLDSIAFPYFISMQYLRHGLLNKVKLETWLDWHDNEWKSSTHHLHFIDSHCMGHLSCNTTKTTIALHGIRACLRGILQSFEQGIIDCKEGNSMLWTWNLLSICKISPLLF